MAQQTEMDKYLESVGQSVFESKGVRGVIVTAQEVFEASDKRYTLEEVQAWVDAAPELPPTPRSTGWVDPFFGSGFDFGSANV